ncbi:glycosyltransferase [Sulfurirhabdus autotrophica]|uniref:Glycosyltransferase involved in cell wall biosynthesis n=1 Tax=Sulfurirhabdus autotrophica TaxID=1706046 RepID=A0A4R3XNX2_9PROT|nr:glycosyltransferase [Sulfurirhabdus autotrophica]TCV79098.1 glycosyltransferase involved in cell wall biosynthesis [Sulfurirhabdus autotrophica]
MSIDQTTPRRKKLLVLTSTFPRWEGDCEPPFVFELSRRLQHRFDVMVLAPHTTGAKQREDIAGMRVIRYRYFFGKWEILAYQGGILAKLKQHSAHYLLVPFFLFAQLRSLLRILRREKIDVIHAHWLIPQGLIAIAALFLKRVQFPALLCTSHGSDLFGLRGMFFSSLKRIVVRYADAVTVVSHQMKSRTIELGINEDKVSVIPMGIDMTNLFVPSHEEVRDLELLFVGRLVVSKAVDVLIMALPAILIEYPHVSLTIVGDGPEKASLKELAIKLGISNQVNFLGAVANPELPVLYRRAAIFVSPSLEEGFGLTIVEALACGCAVIATNLPATREILADGETGLLVPLGDSAAIAHRALLLLADTTLRHSLSRAGRQFAIGKFDWEVVAGRYGCLLDKLVKNSQQPS